MYATRDSLLIKSHKSYSSLVARGFELEGLIISKLKTDSPFCSIRKWFEIERGKFLKQLPTVMQKVLIGNLELTDTLHIGMAYLC